MTMIHAKGARLLKEAEGPVREFMELSMGKLGRTKLLSLTESLEEVRAD